VTPSLPHSLSPLALVSLWSDLEQAYFGKHGSGGDTAEVYAYRLNTGRPEGGKGASEEAAEALVDVCNYFAKARYAAITIDGMSPATWFAAERHSFFHRCYVKVMP